MTEITKLQFTELMAKGLVTESFEKLDLNKDNLISESDLANATNDAIKNSINNLLNSFDDEGDVSELNFDSLGKTSANSASSASSTSSTSSTNSTSSTASTSSTGTTSLTDAPEGYINVDMNTIKTDSVETLNTKLKNVENNLSLLNTQLKNYTKLFTTLTSELEQLKKDRDAKQQEYNTVAEPLPSKQQELTTYTNEYDRIKEELETVNNAIRAEQELEEIEYEKTIEKITEEAINNYKPEEDGTNFEAYFLKQMESLGYCVFSKLTSLNDKALQLSNEAKEVMANIVNTAAVIANIQSLLTPIQADLDDLDGKISLKETEINIPDSRIKGTNDLITTNETYKKTLSTELLSRIAGGGLTGDEVLAKISAAEKKLAIDNKVDLTKCMVAMGADNQFHIYQSNGVSIARTYGSSVVPDGSGRMSDFSVVPEGGDLSKARAVYYFSEVNDDLTKGTATFKPCNYSTYDIQENHDPLAFDVNGDGIKTSATTTIFDIDGDGIKDIVNNVSDWVLAFDKDGNGIAGENGSELFGNNTDLDGDGKADGYKDGFEALKALAKKEGLISDTDSKLDKNDLNLLTKKYGLTMTNGYGGNATSLSDLGITEINLAQTNETSLQKNFDGRQNDLMTQEGATFVVNGQTRDYADVWNSKKSEQVYALQDTEKTEKVLKTNNPEISLKINENGLVALHGEVDFKKIKNNAIKDFSIPQEVLDKIIEYKEEDEEEI